MNLIERLQKMAHLANSDDFEGDIETVRTMLEDAERYRAQFSMPGASNGGLHYIIRNRTDRQIEPCMDKSEIDRRIDEFRFNAQ